MSEAHKDICDVFPRTCAHVLRHGKRGFVCVHVYILVLGVELRVSPTLSKFSIAEIDPPHSDNFQF